MLSVFQCPSFIPRKIVVAIAEILPPGKRVHRFQRSFAGQPSILLNIRITLIYQHDCVPLRPRWIDPNTRCVRKEIPNFHLIKPCVGWESAQKRQSQIVTSEFSASWTSITSISALVVLKTKTNSVERSRLTRIFCALTLGLPATSTKLVLRNLL